MMQYLIQPARLTDLPSLQPLIDQVVHQQMAEFPAFSSAPFFFRFEALFPYSQGMTFIEQGLSQGGWGKLNTLFASPPTTTKEIFEPEVYFEKKVPPKATLTRPTVLDRNPGLSFLTENSLGELGYYALIGQFITEEEAKAVAPGWSGRSEEHTSELQSRLHLVCRLLLEKKKKLSLRNSRSYYVKTFRNQLTILSKTAELLSVKWLHMPDTFVQA